MLTGLTYALLWVAVLLYAVYLRAGRPLATTGDYRRAIGLGATGVTLAVWVLLLEELAARACLSGHWPLANRYEFALCFAWAILSVYLLLEISWKERRAGAFVLAIVLFVAGYAVTRPEAMQAIVPLLPALRSTWLQVHVLTAVVAYSAFGVAAGLGLARLFERRLAGRLPAAKELDRAMGRSLALGFPWLTFSILSGAVWAQNAWGRFWGWDVKETWALVTWLWYLMLLHLRPLPRWRGRRMAILLVVGFCIVVFTFIGVPWLVRVVRLESLHGF
jgi:cytochrome c-type biogenesis protein CcsB